MKKLLILFCLILASCELQAQEANYKIIWDLSDNSDENYLPTTHYDLYIVYTSDSVYTYRDMMLQTQLNQDHFITRLNHDSLFAVCEDSATVVYPLWENGKYVQLALVCYNNLYNAFSPVGISTPYKLPDSRTVQMPRNLRLRK